MIWFVLNMPNLPRLTLLCAISCGSKQMQNVGLRCSLQLVDVRIGRGLDEL